MAVKKKGKLSGGAGKAEAKRDPNLLMSANQIWMAGLGALSRTQEGGTTVFDELVREGPKLQGTALDAAQKVVRDALQGAQKTDNFILEDLTAVLKHIEASTMGLDIRFVVTSLKAGSPERIYDTLYCARGQAENLIKMHKAQMKSDRTSCRCANANQMRLILHTAAYWLMWRVRQALPETSALRVAEFATIRLRLIKLAARVIETASRIRIAFASACPDADIFRALARALRPAPT